MIATGNAIVANYHLKRGIGHFRCNEFREAIAAFDTALLFHPDDPYARWNRATALLSIGDYERGFQEHDVAWRLFRWRNIDHIAHLPVWHGETGARLLAYHELGYGDAIMAMRFLSEVKRRTAALVLVIDPPLLRLARSFGVEATDQVPDDLSGFDFRLPFFGVMSALRQNIATIPSVPYITVPWRIEPGLIGIAWSGRTQAMFSGEQFVAMLGIPDAKLLALQPGNTPHGVEPWSGDFVDLAERMAAMQHIVSVDTAAIHLAGAIGHPSAHLVLPWFGDWRWWRTATWYPTLHTYRQDEPDDWAGPFSMVRTKVIRTSAQSRVV